MTRLLPSFLLSIACAPTLRVAPPAGTAPARLALSLPGPPTRLLVDGVDLAVHDSAPGTSLPAVVCLHAIGHGSGDFEGVDRLLRGRFRVIALDWPSQGASGDDRVPASAARYETLLALVLERLGIERPVLLGNSIGGAAAVRYAASHPVRGLVLANPGGFDPGGWLAGLFIGTLVSHFEDGVRGLARFEPWFTRYYADLLVTPAAAARRAAIVAAGYESAKVLTEAWRSFARPEANLTGLLPRLEVPTLVTWADRDGLVQWGRNRAAVETLPKARIVHFDAGHSAFLEQPEAFARALLDFLDALPAG